MRSILVAALLLAGCAAGGSQGGRTQDSGTLERGKTTYQQVIRRMGEPATQTLTEDHGRIVTYKRPNDTLTLRFRSDGVLTEMSP